DPHATHHRGNDHHHCCLVHIIHRRGEKVICSNSSTVAVTPLTRHGSLVPGWRRLGSRSSIYPSSVLPRRFRTSYPTEVSPPTPATRTLTGAGSKLKAGENRVVDSSCFEETK